MDKAKILKVISKFGEVRETKHYIMVYDKSLKKALIMKRSVHLEDADKNYGQKTRIFSNDEIKKRHMGKIKCIAKFDNETELETILTTYFL
jgi:hypothetical protein